MVKSPRNQRLKEKEHAVVKNSKQTMLGTWIEACKAEPAKADVPMQKKEIEITNITTSTREDELVLKVGFKLLPSRTAFSRITSDLYFDGQKIESMRIRVLQGPLATDEAEFSSVLDMTGIVRGQHIVKFEVYELWSSDEKIASTSKEVTVDYVPLRREDRLVRVPIVKSVAGANLDVVSDEEKQIYREMNEEMKKEVTSRRDEW